MIHGFLEMWNFSSHVQADISLICCALVRYQVERSKRNSVSPHAYVLFSVYLMSRLIIGSHRLIVDLPCK